MFSQSNNLRRIFQRSKLPLSLHLMTIRKALPSAIQET